MKSKQIAVFTLLFLLAAHDQARACHRGMEGAGFHGHEGMPALHEKFFMKVDFLMRHRGELGLRDDQVQSIEGKVFEVKRLMLESGSQKKLAMLEIYKELHAEKPDAEKMKSLVDKKIEAKRTLAYGIVEALLAVRNVLTEDQRAKLKELFWQQKYPQAPGPQPRPA